MRPLCCLPCVCLLLASCEREQPAADTARPAAPPTSAAAVSLTPQDTLFTGTVDAVRRARPGTPPGLLRAARSAPHALYDRVVFEFSGDSVPGYVVQYATKPVRRCGPGDVVSLQGTRQLVVRFEPARAHDAQGSVTVATREASPGHPAVRELKLVCDFEGQVEWALGVAAELPYRVEELADPARLIVDVRHRP